LSVSARNMKNFRINRQPIHQILVNPLIEIEKVMGGLFLASAILLRRIKLDNLSVLILMSL
jgi:hypothetical protein